MADTEKKYQIELLQLAGVVLASSTHTVVIFNLGYVMTSEAWYFKQAFLVG